MLDSSSPNVYNGVGIKRLLPAFEPNSSPPRFKRQKSRPAPSTITTTTTTTATATATTTTTAANTTTVKDENHYPTPVSSSSFGGAMPSSPPIANSLRRPLLRRTRSTVSERSPLAAVPSITLPETGEPILLGRSSNSSHYRLSANRLISRVHIRAAYHAATETMKPKIEIKCLGWNGVKVHCQGRAWELQKDDIFMSETEHAEIMLDVHDSRVVIAWPECSAATPTATSCGGGRGRSPSLDWEAVNDENIEPWEGPRHVPSRTKLTPVSPTPRRTHSAALMQTAQSMAETFLDIYEDEPLPEFGEETQVELPPPVAEAADRLGRTSTRDIGEAMTEMVHGDHDDDHEDDQDEVAQSFAEIPSDLPPMTLFSTKEPLHNRHRRATSSPLSEPSDDEEEEEEPSSPARRHSNSLSPGKCLTLQNHLTNQLAFSRVHTMPLSELYSNLPLALSNTVSKERVKEILLASVCIGEILRVGKDAAGKPLENQYYYMIDEDRDEGRRAAVGGRAGVRNCRKSHKQYYWKKPKKISY